MVPLDTQNAQKKRIRWAWNFVSWTYHKKYGNSKHVARTSRLGTQPCSLASNLGSPKWNPDPYMFPRMDHCPNYSQVSNVTGRSGCNWSANVSVVQAAKSPWSSYAGLVKESMEPLEVMGPAQVFHVSEGGKLLSGLWARNASWIGHCPALREDLLQSPRCEQHGVWGHQTCLQSATEPTLGELGDDGAVFLLFTGRRVMASCAEDTRLKLTCLGSLWMFVVDSWWFMWRLVGNRWWLLCWGSYRCRIGLWSFGTSQPKSRRHWHWKGLNDLEIALRKVGFIAVVWLKFRGYRSSMEFCGSVERSNFFSEDKFFTCQALPMPFTPELSLQVADDQIPAEFGWSQVFKSSRSCFNWPWWRQVSAYENCKALAMCLGGLGGLGFSLLASSWSWDSHGFPISTLITFIPGIHWDFRWRPFWRTDDWDVCRGSAVVALRCPGHGAHFPSDVSNPGPGLHQGFFASRSVGLSRNGFAKRDLGSLEVPIQLWYSTWGFRNNTIWSFFLHYTMTFTAHKFSTGHW